MHLADARWARDAYRSVAGRDDGIKPNGVVDYVVDAEFIDGDLEIDLVSLAVVADDGREFYAVSNEFDPSRANHFVATTVLPQLEAPGDPVWMSRQEIKDGLLVFVGSTTPRFWSWGGLPYDWMVIAQLFGVDERMPDGWLSTGYDITLLVNRAGFSTDPLDPRLPQHTGAAHHALADAHWAQAVLHAIQRRSGARNGWTRT